MQLLLRHKATLDEVHLRYVTFEGLETLDAWQWLLVAARDQLSLRSLTLDNCLYEDEPVCSSESRQSCYSESRQCCYSESRQSGEIAFLKTFKIGAGGLDWTDAINGLVIETKVRPIASSP